MRRGRLTGLLAGGVSVVSLAALATGMAPAGAATVSVKVTPAKNLSNGKTVVVSGKGLPVTTNGKKNAFFIDECNSAVTGQLSVADEPHCAVSLAKALKVNKNGSFKTTFKVATGTVGDGSCGTSGNSTCVIGVGDASGQGAVAAITFK
jgi:hypothetical protein